MVRRAWSIAAGGLLAAALAGCDGAPSIATTSNANPYPPTIQRGGTTYHAAPAAISAVVPDKSDPRELDVFIDERKALLSGELTGGRFLTRAGVRRSDPSSVVVAAAIYTSPQREDITQLDQGSSFVSGSFKVRVELPDPLGRRTVLDASSGKRVPVRQTPPR